MNRLSSIGDLRIVTSFIQRFQPGAREFDVELESLLGFLSGVAELINFRRSQRIAPRVGAHAPSCEHNDSRNNSGRDLHFFFFPNILSNRSVRICSKRSMAPCTGA